MIERKLILFIFCSISFCNSLFAQERKDTLYIESVDFKILTFSSVSCENFDLGFTGRIKFGTIVNKDTLGILDSFISKAKYAKKNRSVDVRAKFVLERGDGGRATICTNGYDVVVDNRLVKTDNKFADFLTMLTEQKQYLKK